MVLSEDNLYQQHQELCNKLNLDSETLNDSWENFQKINKNYILEGDPIHWIGCAIYVACRRTVTPTLGQNVLQGNCVNLTSLLRHCNLSLAQFFFNIKKWCDMTSVPENFCQKINNLEKTFAVTYNVFREYHPIFLKIFKSLEPLELDQSKQHRNRKQKQVLCSTSKIFEFCWILFIINKGKDPNYSNNLVNSFHLLIVVCDWAFKNAFHSNRKDLLNPSFEGLPRNWFYLNLEGSETAPCVVNVLCTNKKMVIDALYIKEYPFKLFLKELFDKGILTGNIDYTGVFEPNVFEKNFKNITNAYETELLNKGDFDEKIFLAEYRRRLLEKAAQESPRGQQFGMVAAQSCLTPLTGRKFLGPRDQNDVTPLGTATESISRLHTLTRIIPELQKYGQLDFTVAKCIFASDELLIFEDATSKGFHHFDKLNGFNIEMIKRILAELAKLHASSLIMQHENVNLFNELALLVEEHIYRDDDDEPNTFREGQDQCLTETMQLQGLDGELKAVLASVRQHHFASIRGALRKKRPFAVFSHGDLWANNIMANDAGAVLFLDFQAMRHTSVAADLSYFLWINLQPEFREQHEAALVAFYLQRLRHHLPPPLARLTAEGLRAEMDEFRMFGFVFALWIMPVFYHRFEAGEKSRHGRHGRPTPTAAEARRLAGLIGAFKRASPRRLT